MGIRFLQLKQVLNIQRKIHRGLNVLFIANDNVSKDLHTTLDWLTLNGYQTECFGNAEYQEFVFTKDTNLQILRESGVLIIMDSTYKTSKHGWKLYTLLLRNTFDSWLPGGHFFVSGEEHDIVAKGIQILKHWASTWKPRYFLIDQSAIEEKAIKNTFPGIIAGEQNVNIYYCTWHCQQTLERQLSSYEKTYNLMIQAIYKTTHIGCENLIDEAIKHTPLDNKKTYLRRYWRGNTDKWGMWSRQHSPLLLQMTATSPVESYHANLKWKGNASFGLIGACRIVHEKNQGYFDRAQITQQEFYTKSISEASTYPFLVGFPHPIQLLLVQEIHAFYERIAKGKPIPELQVTECGCQFFRKYMLPCRHLFHRNLSNDFLTDEH